MQRSVRAILTLAAAVLTFAVATPDTARAQDTSDPCTDPSGCVENGSDYFATQPGTFFEPLGTFGPQIQLMGVPIGGVGLPLNGANIWNTDTIVQRTADIPIGVAPTTPNLLMTALQLESVAPVPLFGNIPIFISLQCNTAASCASSGGVLSTGTMTINGNLAGGTFNSTLDVFFDICTTPGVNGVGCGTGTLINESSVLLSSTGSPWSPTTGAFNVTVPGVDGTNDNPYADLWTNLDVGETNFFPGVGPGGVNTIISETSLFAAHLVGPASIPEPGSLMLLGSGVLGLIPLRWRRRRG